MKISFTLLDAHVEVECSAIHDDLSESTECFKIDNFKANLEREYSEAFVADSRESYLSRSSFKSFDSDEDSEDSDSKSEFIGQQVVAVAEPVKEEKV